MVVERNPNAPPTPADKQPGPRMVQKAPPKTGAAAPAPGVAVPSGTVYQAGMPVHPTETEVPKA